MKNIIGTIRNLTFEDINRNLFLVAIVALLFRIGNFYNTFIPKPFEGILVLVILLTFADLAINKKFKEFFESIGRRNIIALFLLSLSVLVGWFVALFIKDIPLNLNVILEFGNFVISVTVFVLVLFYTRGSAEYRKRYLYALLLPAGYSVFVVVPTLADYFGLTNDGTFLGLTMNPNIVSKILLIPALFFIAHSLFEFKNKWIKIGYIAVSCGMVALLFWVSSRGGLVSLLLSLVFVWLVFSFQAFSWRKILYSGGILFTIFLVGFILTPGSGKQRIILRTLYPSGSDHSSYLSVQEESATDVVGKFISDKSGAHLFLYPERETRFTIWPFYLKYVLMNPFGIGPNTHLSFSLTDNNGEYINSGPHNTFLQIWMWGGLLGICSFLYIFINAFKNLRTQLKLDFSPMSMALLGILFAVSISIMFDDSLAFYWFFIILALALKHENTTA